MTERTVSNVAPMAAVVGCGYWGQNLVRNFSALGALGAVCDEDAATAEATASRYGVPAVSFDELLGSAIPAVAVAAPAARHFDLTRAVLEVDKDVFVEKPLALHVDEALALVDESEKRNRILMVGHLMHYHPGFKVLAEMVRSGDLGSIRYIYSTRLNLGKVRREENILWSFAPHDISMILSLTGAEPISVSATGAAYLNEEVADVSMTHLTFVDGLRAHVFVSWLHPFKEQKFVVVGDRAMAVFDDSLPWERKISVYAHRVDWTGGSTPPVKAEPTAIPLKECEPLREECKHFLHCVRSRSRPLTDGHEGVRVLRVLQAAEAELSMELKLATSGI